MSMKLSVIQITSGYRLWVDFVRNKILYITELLLLVYIIIFNDVIVKYFLEYLNAINVVFILILSLITYFFVGFPRSKQLYNYNVIQIIIISFIVYYTVINFLGVFFGFVSNVYSLKILNVLQNLIYAISYYCFRELYRYMLIRNVNKGKKNLYVIITFLFVLLDIIMEINAYDLFSSIGIFNFICASVIPSVALNALLCYVACKFNFKSLLMIVLILKLPIYFLPIFPDLGYYLNSVLLLSLFFYLYYEFSSILEKYERKIKIKKVNKSKFSMFIWLGLTLVMVGMVSGLFKYHLFAVVSNSMIPEFARGDAVLVEKIKDDELDRLKVGDIIAFYDPSDRMVVHRIESFEVNNGKYSIITKGDNNDSVDSWIVSNRNIYGRVITKIKYIGIPSVELSELINR